MRAAILLAAGASRRFGREDKLKARIGGRPILDHAIANALRSGAGRVILVSPGPVRAPRVTHVRVNGAKALSVSLKAGLRALRPIEREALIFLADMPFASGGRLRLSPGVDAIRPRFGGVPGHPMLIRSAVAKARLGQGDTGLAGAVVAGFTRGVVGNIVDIDTPSVLRRVRLHGSRAFRSRSPKG